PRTFMNDSGRAVIAVMTFYKIGLENVLVVADEVQLPLGRIRIRPAGSAGGHNGLKSGIEQVGSEFARLRLGGDRGEPEWDLSDRVLSRFPPEELEIVTPMIARAADAAETFVHDGVYVAMNRFNAAGDNLKPETTE